MLRFINNKKILITFYNHTGTLCVLQYNTQSPFIMICVITKLEQVANFSPIPYQLNLRDTRALRQLTHSLP